MAAGTADAARLAQQRAAAAVVAAAQAPKATADTKRAKAADVLPAAPDDAVSLQEVLRKAARAGGLPAVTNAGPAAAAVAASGAAAEGPSSTIDEILRKAETQVKADAAAAAAVGSGAIRGRVGERATDDSKIISDFALRRILELQGLNKVGAAHYADLCPKSHALTLASELFSLYCLHGDYHWWMMSARSE